MHIKMASFALLIVWACFVVSWVVISTGTLCSVFNQFLLVLNWNNCCFLLTTTAESIDVELVKSTL